MLIACMAPVLLSIGFGMQWLPVLSIWTACNIPVVMGLHSFQKWEATYHGGVFVLATVPSIFFAWLIAKQEREMFVWRKVALSEARLEHERLFNAFLCHEIRNPVSFFGSRISSSSSFSALLTCASLRSLQ